MKKLINYITKEEYDKLLAYTLKQKKKNSKRYALCIMLGFEAGMRISEIVGWKTIPPLEARHISQDQNSIRILGKGRKERIVPLPKRVNANAIRLLPITITRRAIQKYVTQIGHKVLKKEINFHMLRHGFGSHLAGRNIPLHEIQMLMGHSRLDTTGIYLHSNPKKAIEAARDLFK